MNAQTTLKRIRAILIFFVVALVVSGLTAVPVRFELALVQRWFNAPGMFLPETFPAISYWLSLVAEGVDSAYSEYPFLAYGNDWLAFGHLIIALFISGALKDPVGNRWVIEFAMVACVLVIPWAFVFGAIREVPIGWGLIDSAFGVFGILPLIYARKLSLSLEPQPA